MKLTLKEKKFIEEHLTENTNTLALQVKRYSEIDIKKVIQQIKGRQIAKIKIPSWYEVEDIIYPKHLSLEQCSSEHTARYKSKIYSGTSFVDLTGGFGVDCAFLFASFNQASYVEEQKDLVEIAKDNFKALGINIQVCQADSTDYLSRMLPVDLIYIDPARRDSSGSKTVFIEDCTPNIIDLEPLLEKKSKRTMIKLSPMLDISLGLKSIRNITNVYVISYQNECKELVFLKNNEDNVGSTTIHCINISNTKTDEFSFCKEDEDNTNINYSDQIGQYLYEPNSSIIKAGAYKTIVNKFGVNKLHPNSHLYTSNDLIEDFHGRTFKVENICTLNKKDIKQYLKNIKQANISTRNFPINPPELRKRLSLKDGGNTYIFGTTLADERKVLIICSKI